MTDAPTNLYGLGEQELTRIMAQFGLEPYRARQVMTAMYLHDVLEIERWTALPSAARGALCAGHGVERPRLAETSESADGTIEALLDLPAGGQVEAVAIPAGERLTFCISSQVGCAFGCAFCMTAKLGFQRHLEAGEIVGQVAALRALTLAEPGRYNIVFMGMGEPLHNLTNVSRALALLTSPRAFALGPRRITVSTVGLPDGIDQLAKLQPSPRLAVSLVTADQALREKLMPVARKYDLEGLAEAMRRFGAGKRDRPTLEVVLLDGVNDERRHAESLIALARRAGAKVNLIEFNPTPELPFRPAREERMNMFLSLLTRAGVAGTVRRSRGKDVAGACGQLAFTRTAGRGQQPD